MQCNICCRPHSSKLPFNCATCARNITYIPRLELASALLHKASDEANVNKFVSDLKSEASTVHTPNSDRTRFNVDQLKSSRLEVEQQTSTIKSSSENARQKIEQQKLRISEQRVRLAQRRGNLHASGKILNDDDASLFGSAEQSIQRATRRWSHIHNRTTTSRSFLCKEAAELYGLRQRCSRRPDGSVRDEYWLGDVAAVDLRDLNTTPPETITASLSNIAHLLALASHYLALRLPAELTLPHRDYPLPTIFPPSSSHQSRVNSSESRADSRPLARPRPLYIDKMLPALSKDDSTAYSFFVEGVTYLAWDVAWLCRTQGLDIGAASWEDVCSVGRNLWLLLAAPEADREAATLGRASLGHFSHGSSHNFLGGAEGAQFMKGWQLQSPMKLVDQVKSRLLGDMTGAEWEVVDEREVEESDRTRGMMDENGQNVINGWVTRTTITDSADQRLTDRSKGWTKLKSRND